MDGSYDIGWKENRKASHYDRFCRTFSLVAIGAAFAMVTTGLMRYEWNKPQISEVSFTPCTRCHATGLAEQERLLMALTGDKP